MSVVEQLNTADTAAGGAAEAPATENPAGSVLAGGPVLTRTAEAGSLCEVRNCTNDHVVIVTADQHSFRMSPLGVAEANQATIDTFRLEELASRHVLRLYDDPQSAAAVDSDAFVGLGFLAIIAYFVALSKIDTVQARWTFAFAAPVAVLIAIWIVLKAKKKRLADVGQGLSLVVVFILGVGLPVGVAFEFGDVAALARGGGSAEFFGRLTQTLLIVLASLVPTVLYYIFDRQRATTIRRNFQQQILRLDPDVHTLYDVDAKYGDLLIEAVGRDGVQRARAKTSNPYPIFIAATLLVLGWVLVLPVVNPSNAVADASSVASFLTPRHTTYVFGFLGAYFYAINLIARRYVRGDLRPKAYGSISVRILVVLILSWVLEVAFKPDDWVFVAAFIVGIVPETFFTLVAETRRAALGKITRGALREPHPLTRLEGIDLYDRSRLQDEGVNNVEALAHHDLVELMLATRIPVPRLVDWVDQAILYLHTVNKDGNDIGRDHLRSCGIRTASDLIAVHEDDDLWQVLLSGDVVQPPRRLDLVVKAIVDDEWMADVMTWRRAVAPGERSYQVLDGQLREV
jgi:hypothetical protein